MYTIRGLRYGTKVCAVFMCSNGASSLMACPPSLVFDETRQICEFPAHVAVCAARDSLIEDEGTVVFVHLPSLLWLLTHSCFLTCVSFILRCVAFNIDYLGPWSDR